MSDEKSELPRHVESATQSETLRYRVFREPPSGIFVDALAQHIRKTGQPETFDGLHRGPIPKGARFRILRKIDIDGKKRPEGDLAPCPMCTPNRFLSGALVWFPALQCCAVIGHCCADKEARDEADRDYKWRTARDQQETYLLAALPLVQRKMETVAAARSPADEALAAFRKFRKDGGAIHQHLRNLQKQGGKLLVAEIISRKGGDGEGNDYFGPAGFRGRGAEELQTRDHDFGLIDGGLAVTNDYNPVAELERVARLLQPYSLLTTEEVALEFIVTLSDKDRKEAADALQSAEVVYRKFEVRLTDFWRFWSAANIQRLGNYGSHPENPFPIQTQHEFFEQGIRITLRHRHQECRIPFRYRDLGVSAALWPFPKPQ